MGVSRERSLVLQRPSSRKWGRWCSATWSARGHVVRFARWVNSPTWKLTPPKKNRGGLRGGENDERRRLVRRHQLSHHSGSEMPSGYPMPLKSCCAQSQHKRVEGRPDADEVVREVRASRARVDGFQGCSLTTSWLQRLVRGILSHPGLLHPDASRRWSEARLSRVRAGVPSP